MAIGWLDGDGSPDLVVANGESGDASVLLSLSTQSPVEGSFYAALAQGETIILLMDDRVPRGDRGVQCVQGHVARRAVLSGE